MINQDHDQWHTYKIGTNWYKNSNYREKVKGFFQIIFGRHLISSYNI